jgi:sterol desaturase/sphingolipid hydroxylase (fatty acid hydroxylase superfamily)
MMTMSADDKTTQPPMARATAGAPTWFVVVLLAVCAACFVLLAGWSQLSPMLVNGCDELLKGSQRCASGINKIWIYAFSLAFFPVILLLQRWRPAAPDQPSFAAGLVVDCCWFIAFPLLGVWLPTLFEEFLANTFGEQLSALRLGLLGTLPFAAQLVIVVIAADFLAWFSHVIRHKVPVFWEFHKIHHSQVHLNYFSTMRLHPLDLIVNALIRFLPFSLLGLQMAVPAFIGWIAFQRFYEMVVHSNLRTNMGWLRYLLVTPQSHRIHHSMNREHLDSNFGNIFSIWDFLFGTQIRDYTVYPATGVHDRHVPATSSARPGAAVRTFVAELYYPLVAITRMLRPR